jgi:hypothetical protein
MPSATVGSPICSCQRQIAEQRRRPCIERRVSVTARFLRQSTGDETFPHAGRSENEKVLVVLNPLRILRQSANDGLLQSTSSLVVDVFDAGVMSEPRACNKNIPLKPITIPLAGDYWSPSDRNH